MLLGCSVAAYLLLTAELHQPFHVGRRALRFFDLVVYRDAAKSMLSGTSLYGAPMFHGLHFTYPPIAALALTPLESFSSSVDRLLSIAGNTFALVALLKLTVNLKGVRGTHAWRLAAVAAAAALWLEPVSTAVGYGQIDILVATLVVFDLSRDDGWRGKGAAVGLAAGLKLTPLMFVPYLALTGRRRAATVAGATFAATVLAGFATVPSDAWTYWRGTFVQSSRVGFLPDYSNQSLWGVIGRMTHSSEVGAAWLPVIAAVGVVGLSVAVLAARRGDDASGFSLCAITGLLISPIAWTHHWTIVVPGLVLLIVTARAERSRLKFLVAGALAVIGYGYVPERVSASSTLHLGFFGSLAADAYALPALIVIVVSCARALWLKLSSADVGLRTPAGSIARV